LFFKLYLSCVIIEDIYNESKIEERKDIRVREPE